LVIPGEVMLPDGPVLGPGVVAESADGVGSVVDADDALDPCVEPVAPGAG